MADRGRDRRTIMLSAQYKKATSEPDEYVKFMMEEGDMNVWYVLLHNFDGDNGEFAGGEYLVKVILPQEFPYKPPEFYFHTPNGVYGIDTKVCISIGEYHADQYRAALGVSGFVRQLCNGMIGWKSLGGGIEIHSTDVKTKKKLAADSWDFNRKKYPELVARIESCYEDYSSKWDFSKIPLPTIQRLGLKAPKPAT